MLPFSSVANGPLNRAFSPVAAKSPATPNFYPLKPIGSDNISQFKNSFNSFDNLRRGSVKPPTPPMPSMPSSYDPMKTMRDANSFRSSTPVSIPADDAMRQWGWKFSDKPPVGKPFTKLPNQ